MARYKAFLSDLDGTLVDSEPQHADAWLAVLAGYQLNFDHQWFEKYIGTSDSFLAQDVINDHKVNRTVRELQTEKQLSYHQMMKESGQLFPGILDLLQRIHSAYPMAIATNSGRQDAEVVFDATALRPFATYSVTADDVKKLKPAPDIYLKAAKLLGFPPEQCVVCEDSPAGITGARAAGCYVIGIMSSQPAEKLAEAHEVLPDSAAALKRVYELLSEV